MPELKLFERQPLECATLDAAGAADQTGELIWNEQGDFHKAFTYRVATSHAYVFAFRPARLRPNDEPPICPLQETRRVVEITRTSPTSSLDHIG